jgi:WD40 repeat protein
MIKHLLFYVLLISSISAFSQEQTGTKPIVLADANNDLNALAVSPLKLKRLAVAGWNNEVLIYNTDSPYKLVQKLIGHTAPINAIAYTLSGNMMASGGSDMNIRLYDSMYKFIPLIEDLNNRHLAQVTSLIFDRTGKFLFSGDKEGRLMLWDVLNKKAIKYYMTGNTINDICLSPTSANIFIAHSDKQIKVIALAGGKILKTLDGHTDVVNALAISANNQFLISGSNDKTARIWDLKTWKPTQVLKVDSWKITAVAFTDDSKYCVTGCNDGAIYIWEVETGKLVSKSVYSDLNIRDIAFSKNNKLVYVAPKLKETTDYGARIVPSNIPMSIVAALPAKLLNPAQKSLDSIMQIRPLTKQYSIKYKNILIPKTTSKNENSPINSNENAGNSGKLDSAIIYKTPMNQVPKKK